MTSGKRKRGGASMPCPKCGSVSRVRETRLVGEDRVERDRVCRKDKRHKFLTVETVE